MKHSPDHTADAPWHMQQVFALTDHQKEELLMSFFACYEANERILHALRVTPAKILTRDEQSKLGAASHAKFTMLTILTAANLTPSPIHHA